MYSWQSLKSELCWCIERLCRGNVNIYSTVWLDLKVGGSVSPDGSVLWSECEGQRRPREAAQCVRVSVRERREERPERSTGVQCCSTLHSTQSCQLRTVKLSLKLSWDKNINTDELLMEWNKASEMWWCALSVWKSDLCFLCIARSYPEKYLRVFSCISPPHSKRNQL